jgi:hypothetical protein
MSRREDRERKVAGWLEQLQGWKASGESLLAYAQARGIEASSMYYWRKVLRREGHWPEDPGEGRGARREAVTADAVRVPLRFARVRLEESPRRSAVTVRVTLANGRCTEIELGDAQALSEVLAVLERPS